jgi:membrane associated rhomboid family serine protease
MVVVWLIGGFVAVHLLRWLLPEEPSAWITLVLAFIPARLSALATDLPGGEIATYTSFITHLFVHGDLTHLAINAAWLLAFGSPVARRMNAARFLTFFFLCGIAGALFFVLVEGPVESLMVGASGAISGLMGAAFRFLFQTGPDGRPLTFKVGARPPPLLGLMQTLQDRRVVLAIAGWTVLNVLLALGATGLTDAAGIAWEAHLGGFYAGLLIFGLFDQVREPAEPAGDDAAGAA